MNISLPRRGSMAAILAAAMSLAACQTIDSGNVAASPPPARARNVILFVGDGMGISTITAARIYEGQKRGETGEENLLSFEKFPQTALVKTYNTDSQVPDSAGTATALNSGVKTRMGFIGVGPAAEPDDCATGKANPLTSTAELARKAGLRVGVVTTTRITHATPAAVYAHSVDRDWEADSDIPESERPEGCIDIARQLLAFPFDVALGGGRDKFFGSLGGGQRLGGDARLPYEWAQRTGGSFVESEAALADAAADKPVLGLFSPSDMTYMPDRKPDTTEPTLTTMTAAAIDRLSRGGKGYYLMVEGGRIDHAHHAGRAGYALEETVEFARAVQYAVDHTDPRETLILVTADHSHGLTISGYPRRGNPILGVVIPRGGSADQPAKPSLAKDGKPYTTLGYANGPGAIAGERAAPETGLGARQQALLPFSSELHGGEDVALFATGPGSQAVHGVIEQNVIAHIARRALGIE